MSSFFLALDQSTSSTKVLLLDTNGSVIDRESRQHQQLYPKPGWVEHDPEEIWWNTQAVFKDLLQRHGDKLADIQALSITNQRETVLCFDRASGQPLHNAIVWQCRRGEPICQRLRTKGIENSVVEKTGLKLDTYFSASKISWLIENNDDLKRGLDSGKAVFSTVDGWLVHRLTNGRSFNTDHTNASRTLLYNISTLDWDEELCGYFGVPLDALPQILSCDAEFGQTDLGGLLPGPVPIRGVLGDSQASLLAQGCLQPGDVKATFGTGTSILQNIGNTPKIPSGGGVAALAWVIDNKPTYAIEGLINYSAATLDWLVKQLGLFTSSREIDSLAATIPENEGVYIIPAFAGLSAPYWKPNARASIVGLTARSTRAHIARAAIESISYQVYDAIGMISSESGLDPRVLLADGGPTRSEILMQFTADLIGVPLKVNPVAELSPVGAVIAGMHGLGIHPVNPSHPLYQAQWKVYRPKDKVAGFLEGWHAAINSL